MSDHSAEHTHPQAELSQDAPAQGWRLDLALAALLPLGVSGALAVRTGAWAPWEAERARLLEHMSNTQQWLTLWHPQLEGAGPQALSELPFGWWSSALSYTWLPSELGLRAPRLLLLALCGLTLYAATRHALSALSRSPHEARLGAWLALALWWTTPSVFFGGAYLLSGTGWLWCTLSALLPLTPHGGRPYIRVLAALTWVASTLSLGLIGALTPLLAWLSPPHPPSHTPPHTPPHTPSEPISKKVHPLKGLFGGLACVLVGLGLWRLGLKSGALLGGSPLGEVSSWGALLVGHAGLTGPQSAADYGGFHLSARLLAYALLPLGALAPAALAHLWAGEPAERSLAEHSLRWGGAIFLVLALNMSLGPFIGGSPAGSGALAALLAPPLAVLVAAAFVTLSREARGVSFALTSALLWLLVYGDVKRDPSLLLSPLMGEPLMGLAAPFKHWAPARLLSYATLGVMIALLTPLRDTLASRLPRWGSSLLRRLTLPTLAGLSLCAPFALAYTAVGLSAHLSQRALIDTHARHATEGEPLARCGLSEQEAARSFYLSKLPSVSVDELIEAAKQGERRFFVLKRPDLPQLSERFRRGAGAHLPLLDDSSHAHLLAVTTLKEGERDLNPISHATLEALPPNVITLSSPFDFEGKVELVAWALEPQALNIGGEAKLKLYWRAKRSMSRNWKVFVHIDAHGQRIHADHDPVEGLLPTARWREGELIQDVYPFKVKPTLTPATFKAYVGLYRGKRRLKIKEGPKGRVTKDNRALLGHVRVH